MKSISTLFRQLSLIVVLISAFSLSAWGEDVTISFASTAQRVSQDNSKQVWKNGDVTFTNNKASSTTNVADYSNPIRLYANSEIVIEAPGNITQIIATASESKYATALKNSVGDEASVSGSIVTITPTASATSYTIAQLTAQVRLDDITVTYTTAPAQAHTVTFSAGTGTCTETTLTGTSIELPSATPCNSDWTFAGWSESEISETTTKPTIFNAGDNYNPQNDITLYAVYVNETTETTNSGTIWVPKPISEIQSNDVVVITMKNSSGVYAATNNNGTGSAPAATKVTVDSNNQLTGTIEDNIKWNISNSSGNLTIYPNGTTEKWLYCTSDNNGVRVGTNTNKTFTIDGSSGYLQHTGTSRYLGVYNSQDWRCYTNTTGNIANQTLGFYVQTTGFAIVTTYTYNSNPICGGVQLDPLATPANLTADNITDNSFTAKWDPVVNATKYEVTLGGDTYTTTNTFYPFTNLNPETNYTFKVRAIGDNETYRNSEIATSGTIKTLPIIVNNIAEFITKANTENNVTISGEVTVTAVSDDKKNIWIKDNYGAILIYSTTATTYVAGDKFSGLKGKYKYYNNTTHEITSPIFPNEKTQGEAPDAETITISTIDDTYINKYVKIENVVYSGIVTDGRTFTDGTKSINTYDTYFAADANIQINDVVTLIAIVGKYNSNYQLYVVESELISRSAILTVSTETIDFGTVETGTEATETFTISGQYLTEDIRIESSNSELVEVSSESLTPTDGSISETNITVKLNTESANEINETITITSGDVEKIINVTATIYAPAQKYIVTFHYNDGSEKALETSILEGLAEYAPTLSSDNHNITFIGWSTEEITEELTECPEVYNNETSEVLIGDLDLYPVYSSQQTTLKPFDLNSTEPQQVVIAANINDEWYALPKSLPKPNGGTQTFGSLTIETTPLNHVTIINGSDYIWTISKTDDSYTISNGTNYLYGEVGGTKLYSNTTTTKTCTILKNGDNYEIRPSTAEDRSIIFRTSSYNVVGHYKTNNIDNKEYYQPTILPVTSTTTTYSSTPKWIVDEEATITEDVFANLIVASGAKLNVTSNATINTLTIKSNLDEAGQVAITSGSLTAQKVVVEKTIDASRWFFFSLPFDCKISDIVATYVNGGAKLEYAPDASTGDYVITEYNGGWVELIGTSHTLKANQGYIIGHFGSGDVTVKFPSNSAQNISAPANATLAKTSDNGFNLIGLPYYQKVNASLNNVNHLSIPNEDGETYNQTEDLSLLANIAPFTSFFVQTEAENIEFNLGAQQNAAPRLDGRSNRASLHQAVVTLTDANGGADKTTIINNPSKTTDYEIGHDLTKLIGYAEIPQIYSLQGDEMLAFNSLAIDNSTVIPLGIYAHADGDYTFSLSEKSVGDLEGWELYDNETGKTTRLANEDLTVNLAQGTHEGRFEIRLQQRISTDCDNAMGDMTTWTANGTLNINNLPADAVVYIYDAVGRMVYVANNNSTTFNYTFAARGVYNIVVRTAENSVSFKTIY